MKTCVKILKEDDHVDFSFFVQFHVAFGVFGRVVMHVTRS